MDNATFYYVFSGENREICDIVIRQPKVWEFLKLDMDVDAIIEPFMAFVDLCDMTEEQRSKYKNLDLIFHDHMVCEMEKCPQKSKLNSLVWALKYLCNTNHVEYDINKGTISISKIEKINRDNFDILQEYILSIFHVKKPTEKDKVKIRAKSDKQRDRVLRMKRMMEEKKRKKDLCLADIVKVVQNGGAFISHNELLDFTYWQLMDRYIDIMKIDSYRTYMDYKLSPKFEMKEERKTHWTEDIKVQ